MKKRVFQKYEILREIYKNQSILRKHQRGISIKQLKTQLHKGTLKGIYDILFNNIKGGLVGKVSGKGYTTKVMITKSGINRIKWQEKNQ